MVATVMDPVPFHVSIGICIVGLAQLLIMFATPAPVAVVFIGMAMYLVPATFLPALCIVGAILFAHAMGHDNILLKTVEMMVTPILVVLNLQRLAFLPADIGLAAASEVVYLASKDLVKKGLVFALRYLILPFLKILLTVLGAVLNFFDTDNLLPGVLFVAGLGLFFYMRGDLKVKKVPAKTYRRRPDVPESIQFTFLSGN